MFPGTSSATPADLDRYTEAAREGSDRVRTAAAEVSEALAAFRASEGRAAFVPVVSEPDLGATFLALRWDRLGEWVAQVADAFTVAGDGADGTVTTFDLALAALGLPPWAPPAYDTVVRGDRLVIDTGRGDDVVTVTTTDEGIALTIDGRTYLVDTDAEGIVFRAGAGDDVVDLSEAAGRPFTIDGGAGDDQLTGSAGEDVVIGGGGLDLVYGLDGDDVIVGGSGRDHLDGGAGDDVLDGGGADDIVSGGEGDDRVLGGDGDDVLFGGPGFDDVAGGEGADDLHVEAFDRVSGVGPSDDVVRSTVDLTLIEDITVVPAGGAFEAQVRSDLVTLASTEQGRILLESLRGHPITVVPPGDDNPAFQWHVGNREVTYAPNVGPVDHGFGPVGADRPVEALSVSPLVALHHELVHASHTVNDQRVDGAYNGDDRNQLDTDRDGDIDDDDEVIANEERATTGLPVDPDSDPSTPDVDVSEVLPDSVDTSENAIRDELGLPERERY